MSLINEAHKLQSLAERVMQIDSSDEGSFTVSGGEAHEALQQASDYIVNFNMKGLRRIEKDLFFPWALKKVSELVLDRDVAYAFRSMMDDLEKEGKNLVNLGDSLMVCIRKHSAVSTFETRFSRLSDCSLIQNRVAHMKSSTASIPHFEQVATTSAAIASGAQKMLQIEDSYLVPTIAAIVPAKEQKSFNDKVIRNLGIFDSRLYLVGMYRALQDLNDRKELNLFDDSIPILARKMIPWWTRSLYEPRVGKALDFGRKTDGP